MVRSSRSPDGAFRQHHESPENKKTHCSEEQWGRGCRRQRRRIIYELRARPSPLFGGDPPPAAGSGGMHTDVYHRAGRYAGSSRIATSTFRDEEAYVTEALGSTRTCSRTSGSTADLVRAPACRETGCSTSCSSLIPVAEGRPKTDLAMHRMLRQPSAGRSPARRRPLVRRVAFRTAADR